MSRETTSTTPEQKAKWAEAEKARRASAYGQRRELSARTEKKEAKLVKARFNWEKFRVKSQGGDADLTRKQWRDIQASYNHRCVYCNGGGEMTMEHIVPINKGGTHTIDNVIPACLDCNRKKNKLSLLRFMYKMLNSNV